ncbi:hypothetical protein UlMin_016117 [Ulmus minor]
MVFLNTMFLFLVQHLVLTSGIHPPRHSLHMDKAALLEIKKAIKLDPKSKLANWNDSVHVCQFNGVWCDHHHQHRVSKLNLNDSQLVGFLSPFISNLTGLRSLMLVDNHFYGRIPTELSSLRHLRLLDLRQNNFHGPIPEFHPIPSNLSLVDFSENNLNTTLSPSFFSNFTSLLVFDVSGNSITGQIPKEVGNCVKLWSLNFYNNQLYGELPHSLINLTQLYNFDVENNSLVGELPSKIVRNWPGLIYLHLSLNNFSAHDNNTNLDPFFTSLENCTLLEELQLSGLQISARLPSSIARLGSRLNILLLQENQLLGSIPPAIGSLSNLTTLNLTSNLLSGTIPAELSQLIMMEQLFLGHNLFPGPIPDFLGQFPHLGLLDLSNNNLSGEIPASLGNLSQLMYLFLNNNSLSGKIPPTLGHCTVLNKIDLSHNRLTGMIPPEISGMSEVRIFINLSNNRLEGPLPVELSKLDDVQEIDLSSNNLNGSLFPQISNCIGIRLLNLSHNFFEGQLPDSIGELKNLEIFDISGNHFSGMIPPSMNKSQALTYLNFSFNDFEGKIPSGGIFSSLTYLSFLGNKHLCGTNITGIPMCPRKRHLFRSRVFLIIFVIVIFVSAFLSTIFCVIGFQRIKVLISSKKSEAAKKPAAPAAPELPHNFPRITYRELSDSTGGFDDQRLIGSGSYGRVYKGILSDGTAIAVKVLHLQTGNSTKSFNRECQVLKRIRHRNLMRIITACSLPDFKALVLPYMSNGSLDSRLYPHSRDGLGSGSSDLSLIQRVNICGDIAEGMAYLHHHSPVRVIHCDLKPSNVLLNDDMTALVSDFGIARLVMTVAGGNAAVENMGNSTANMLSGSIGYIAPEYGFGSNTSTKGDVYSFGILVLEMVTRKRPIDDMFVGGLSLPRWVKSHYHGRVEKVVDSSLLRASRDQSPEVNKMWEVAIGELIELGILCTQESPSTRPTMLDAADDLDRLKRYLTGDTTTTFASSLGISSSTLGDD